jgi:L-ornithine N5-oxygenase
MTLMNPHPLHDVIGIGFGPANIALAIAAEELHPGLDIHFIERNARAGWQEEMLLPESDIQNHPLRDLVTPRNPRSRYTFVNFLFEQGRLFEHLNLPLAHPLRVEYRQYVMWVAQHFAQRTRYGHAVRAIVPTIEGGRIASWRVDCDDGHTVHGRALVVAPGRTPRIPQPFDGVDDVRIVHLTRFMSAFLAVKARVAAPRIAVIGGSQSAVELLLHIAGNLPQGEVIGINRNFGFRQKDTSPFSDEVYFPEFVDTFFHATPAQKRNLRSELASTNYSSADRDVLDALYVQMYRNRILHKAGLSVQHLTSVVNVRCDAQAVHLALTHGLNGGSETVPFDLVVLATGFKDLGNAADDEPYPALMAGLAGHLDLVDGALNIDIDYSVRLRAPVQGGHAPVFLNGLCEATHGMGDAGSFSLLSLRSATIVDSLAEALGSSPGGRNAATRARHRPVAGALVPAHTQPVA